MVNWNWPRDMQGDMNNVSFHGKKTNTIDSDGLHRPCFVGGRGIGRFDCVRRTIMWPYNHCEWKVVTYGAGALKRAKQKIRDRIILITLSILPTIVLVLGILGFVK